MATADLNPGTLSRDDTYTGRFANLDSQRVEGSTMEKGQLGRFADTAVIVTGGGHGIGRACAVRLAEEGARIAVADLDPIAAQQVATDLTTRTAGTRPSGWM
jgi:NADP-dependent 3-hydroxy acid dehydrogenase YdfG